MGTALPGVATRIAGAVDGIGELQVQGPTLYDGYLGRPEATAASYTEDGWFRTGDIASIDADGTHRIVGRASTDLIKSGGYRIGAGEVENALLAHPAVREAAVVGAPHPDLGQEIVAYVVADGVRGRGADRFRGGPAVGAQEAAPGPLPRRTAAQRDGQAAKAVAPTAVTGIGVGLVPGDGRGPAVAACRAASKIGPTLRTPI